MPPKTGKRKAGRGAEVAEKALQKATTEADACEAGGPEDGGVDAEMLEAIIQDLDAQVETRCGLILEEVESQKLALRGQFSVEKLKLPKAIRQMPLKQFLEDYGEDVHAILTTAIRSTAPSTYDGGDAEGEEQPRTVVKGSRNTRAAAAAAATGGDTSRGNYASRPTLPMETPSKYGSSSSAATGGGGMVMATPGTAARLARRGETVLSLNGSPLLIAPDAALAANAAAAAAGATATRRGQRSAAQPQQQQQQQQQQQHQHPAEGAVGLLQQGVASLAGDDVTALTDDMRATARGKLQTLQDQIAQLMNQLA